MVIVSTDATPEDTPPNTDVSSQPQTRLPPRAQSLYNRIHPQPSEMTDVMGSVKLDLLNITAGLSQPEFSSSPSNQSNMPPPGVLQEPSTHNSNPETGVAKIYGMLNELLEQLSANRQASIQLHTLAAGVKVCATYLAQCTLNESDLAV